MAASVFDAANSFKNLLITLLFSQDLRFDFLQIYCFFADLKQNFMKYLFLSLAIIFELIGTGFMQASNGFSKTIPTILTIVAYTICFFFFSHALKSIPLGIAYAIWGGLGIVLSAIISIVILNNP